MRSRLSLLDSAIVLLASVSLSTFLLWAAGEILGLGIFVDPPDFLRAAANRVFAAVTTGAIGSAVLYLVRRQLRGQEAAPPYVVYIVALSVLLVGIIVVLARVLPDRGAPGVDVENRSTAHTSITFVARDLEANTHRIEISSPFFGSETSYPLRLHHHFPLLGTQSVTFLRDEVVLGSLSSHHVDLFGVCRIPETARIAVLIKEWAGGNSMGDVWVAASFDNGTQRVVFDTVGAVQGLPPSSVIRCQHDEGHWVESESSGASFTPCECGWSSALSADRLASEFYDRLVPFDDPDSWTQLSPLHLGSGEVRDVSRVIIRAGLDDLLQVIRRLGDRSPVHVDRLKSLSFEVMAVSSLGDGILRSWSVLLARRVGDQYWEALYDAPLSGKYQPDVTLLGFVDTVNIDIEICVQECDWWAQTGSVRFDLKKHTMTVLRLNP